MSEQHERILVFCERLANESSCESVVRELESYYEVVAFGPGWPKAALSEHDLEGARFFLELDSASGRFSRPQGLERLSAPKFAWVTDTHKKPDFHRSISREMDLTFFSMKNWGHVLEGRALWLPLHCDTRIFQPIAREREIDIAFVGSHGWRADPILRIAEKHKLRAHVECTTGELEKTKTAEIYARSKLVFNRHVANDLNFRVFEATACGRLLLTDAQWNGQYELFDDEKHFVLYTDEADLEEKVLKYLNDEPARARIEEAAAEHTAKNHSTRARVAQLRGAIEAFLAEQRRPEVPMRPEPRVSRRWLCYADDPPPNVSGRSYGESLAYALAAGGDDVVLARRRRSLLAKAPELPARADEPRVLELDVNACDEATGVNAQLSETAALHAALSKIASNLEPDAVLAEGARGALVAQPLAARRGLPFVLALEECEVLRRKNRLTREQLYWAEVQQWGVERARLVLVPSEAQNEAVRRHYRGAQVMTLDLKPSLETPRDARRLLGRLGLDGTNYVLFLGRDMSERDVLSVLRNVNDPALVLTDRGVWLKKHEPRIALLSDRSARGPVLGALLRSAELVVALDGEDPRAREAHALGCRIHGAQASPLEGDVRSLDAIFEERGRARPRDPQASKAQLAHAVQ